MSAKEQAVEWLERNKSCGWQCRKCNITLQRTFDALDEVARRAIVDAVCLCKIEDFEKYEQLLWLVALLNDSEFEKLVGNISKLAPFEKTLAWRIIRLSAGNQGTWRFDQTRRRVSFCRPRFHLHPAIAPSLLAATICAGTESQDALALLDYFEAIADRHPLLKKALPLWRQELERREEERKAEWLRQQERKRIEIAQREAELAAKEAEFQIIEARGPAAIMRAVLDVTTLNGWDCSERWAKTTESALRTLPREMLEQVAHKIASQPPSRIWSGLRRRVEHLLKSQAHSAERTGWIAQLEHLPLPEKLRIACDSKWSLTYFPNSWAEQIIHEVSVIPDELRDRLLTKLMRLQRRNPWRTVRQLLIRRICD